MATADELHRSAPVVDLHVHGPDFVPQPFRRLYHLSGPRRPRDTGFDVLARAGVDVAVATAVGDPIVTRWYLGGRRGRPSRSSWPSSSGVPPGTAWPSPGR
jgi:hypothetical protein